MTLEARRWSGAFQRAVLTSAGNYWYCVVMDNTVWQTGGLILNLFDPDALLKWVRVKRGGGPVLGMRNSDPLWCVEDPEAELT